MNATIKLSAKATHEFWEIPVLFEDESLLALDKPAGLLVSPDPIDSTLPSLMQLLHDGIAAGAPWAVQRRLSFLSHIQRTERELGGVMLLAKSKTDLVALADQFGTEKPVQRCVALVHGSPREARFDVNARLAPHPLNAGQWCVNPKDGKKAQTQFTVLERFARHTLLQCRPITWRPHQVRVHLQNSGLRVVGDELYGGRPLLLSELKSGYRLKPGRVERPLISSPAVHAEQLEFTHPVTAAPVCISSPWPKSLRVALKYLGEFGRTG